MSDFRQQVREHYDSQSLSPEKVAAILANGRAAAEGKEEKTVAFPTPTKKSWNRFIPALAAAVVLLLSGVWWMTRPAKVSYTAMMPGVIEFFDKNSDSLLPAPQEKEALHEMLVSKGAPKDFEIPKTLMPLQSAACQVVDVKGEKAYLSCYWRESNTGNPHDLIHLLVARADDFTDKPPAHGTPPRTREMNGWSFASWSHGDIIYMLAAAAPLEKVMPYLSAIERATEKAYLLPGNDLDKIEVAGMRTRPKGEEHTPSLVEVRKYPRGERIPVLPPQVTAESVCDCNMQTASRANP